jgi:hypothetical protein
MDGGSVERWEDANYRKVYERILQGRWEEFDPWQIGELLLAAEQCLLTVEEYRAVANQDMYHGAGSVCHTFPFHLVFRDAD